MALHNELGKEGETRAIRYLMQHGYKIRHTNWRFEKLELDIVAEDNGWLVIVEVKTRSTETFEHPEEAITNSKIRRIVTAADAYIQMYQVDLPTRFDVISVIPVRNSYKIDHIVDAFVSPVN